MKRAFFVGIVLSFAATVLAGAFAADPNSSSKNTPPADQQKKAQPVSYFQPTESDTTATVNGIDYQAVAGTLVVHPKGYDDAPQTKGEQAKSSQAPAGPSSNPEAEASMFYVAYFKRGAAPGSRPVTFLYNGGPGSSTVWLHMGAFGPKRVVTSDHNHTPAAPYQVIDNPETLLDASDLVFIDAPGTGFSRIAGKDKEKQFFGVDQDAYAFSQFVKEFLTKFSRWNSPKYLFGESYGTPRSAVLVNMLQNDDDIDFNGVILLSQILNFDLSIDGPETNPGIDDAYVVGLPTYAATAWYHHKLPKQPKDLVPFLHQVEHFATTQYRLALGAGSSLPQQQKMAIAQTLHNYTGLPVVYILKANLRISGGMFEKNLEGDQDMTTGRLDTRFSGITLDPLSKEAEYDPQSAAISSAYVSAFNDYVRSTLKYGFDETYKPEIDTFKWWDFKHKQPNMPFAFPGATNVMPDLANAMKTNPNLKILLNGGYFDLATPYYEGWYEMHHLPIPAKLQNNIQYRYYQSGHMVYANEASLRQLHDNVAAFIQSTDNQNH